MLQFTTEKTWTQPFFTLFLIEQLFYPRKPFLITFSSLHTFASHLTPRISTTKVNNPRIVIWFQSGRFQPLHPPRQHQPRASKLLLMTLADPISDATLVGSLSLIVMHIQVSYSHNRPKTQSTLALEHSALPWQHRRYERHGHAFARRLLFSGYPDVDRCPAREWHVLYYRDPVICRNIPLHQLSPFVETEPEVRSRLIRNTVVFQIAGTHSIPTSRIWPSHGGPHHVVPALLESRSQIRFLATCFWHEARIGTFWGRDSFEALSVDPSHRTGMIASTSR